MCVDLCPTSFEGWILYAECLVELSEIKKAMIAIDLVPNGPETPYITLPEPEMTYSLSIPANLNSTDCF